MVAELDLFAAAFSDDPYPIYHSLREQSPVQTIGDSSTWMLTGFDAVYSALRDHQTFSSATLGGYEREHRADQAERDAGLGFVLINDDPPRHTRFRGLVNRAFTPRRIDDLEPWIETIVDELLNAIDEQPVDIVGSFTIPFPVTVISTLLGIPPEERERFKRWSNALVGGAGGFSGDREAELSDMRGFLGDAVAVAVQLGDLPLGQFPPIHLHTFHSCAACFEPRNQAGVALAIFLDHHTLIGNRQRSIHQRQDLAPSIGRPNPIRRFYPHLFQHRRRLGTAGDRDDIRERRQKLLAVDVSLDLGNQFARSHAGHQDHDVNLSGNEPMGKVDRLAARFQRNLAHRRAHVRHTAMPLNKSRHFARHTAFKCRHAKSIKTSRFRCHHCGTFRLRSLVAFTGVGCFIYGTTTVISNKLNKSIHLPFAEPASLP